MDWVFSLVSKFRLAAGGYNKYCNMNNKLLFHYTTADAAIGIIKNKFLWATDIRFLNDSEEFIYGCKMVKDIADQLKKGDIEHDIDNNLIEALSSVAEFLVNDEDYFGAAYVISLSEKKDSLSQWRAYSSDGGYALGWSVDKLRKLAKLRGARLVKCIYKEDAQRKFVLRIIRFISHKLKNVQTYTWQKLLESCIREYAITFILQRFMPRLKHAAFEDEEEWRIVIPSGAPINFRSGRFGVVPYVEYSIRNDDPVPVAENIFVDHESFYMPENLTVGPSENQKLAKMGVQKLLKAVSKSNCEIELSNLPYRHMRK